MPQAKKKPPAEPRPDDEPPQEEAQAAPESDEGSGEGERGGGAELRIIVKADVIEIDVPRDGNEVDTLQRVATLVDEL